MYLTVLYAGFFNNNGTIKWNFRPNEKTRVFLFFPDNFIIFNQIFCTLEFVNCKIDYFFRVNHYFSNRFR